MTKIQSVFILASLCVLASAYEKPCMYKGKPYKDGQTFKDDCNDCICNDGDVACTKKGCPKDSCNYKGNPYKHGQKFKDDCNDCECDDGKVECSKRVCPKDSCTYEGKTYEHGETFKDDCNDCKCHDGKVTCSKRVCTKRCSYNDEYYDEGYDVKSKDPCQRCVCKMAR